MKQFAEFELTTELRERFQQALDNREQDFIVQTLDEVNPADITALLSEFNADESKFVLELLDVDTRAEIIRNLEPDTRKNFLKVFEVPALVEFMNLLDSDDAADILNELPIKTSEEVIAGLEPVIRSQVIDLLRYDENVAGGLMAKELIRARDHWTVVECIKEIRKQAQDVVTKFYTVYVVDENDKLVGRVPLQSLILTDARTLVKDIVEDVQPVETYWEDTEVAEHMQKYNLESVPVVNVQGTLVGRITVDDVLDVVTEQAEEDRQLMSGITEDVEEDDTVWKNTRARLPWLVIGIVGGIISARFMGLFEDQLAKVTAISFFVPLIQATGGNVGIQSSSIVVQSLAHDHDEDGLVKRLAKVFSVAILNGFFLAVLVLGVTLLVFSNQQLSFVVSISLFAVVIFASFVGTATPLILNKLGFNPALASGPFITTINDLLGLAVYFLTVSLLL
jgi:magnesium transporter